MNQEKQKLMFFFNYRFRIPSGTSTELTDLLMNLLKRNAKDRLEFDDFFNHPFIKTPQSKPVPVPRSNGTSNNDCSSGSSSPIQSPVSYGSPLVMQLTASSPKNGTSGTSHASSSDSDEQLNDFVLVPSANSSKFDLNDNRSICKSNSSGMLLTLTQLSNLNHPQPVPVPTQKRAYERLRKSSSLAKFERSSSEPNWTRENNNIASGIEGKENFPLETSISSGSEGSNLNGNLFMVDISQLSPPAVKFVIGTPPGSGLGNASFSGNRRRSTPILSTISPNYQTPLMRQLTPPILNGVTSNENPFLPALCSPEHELNLTRDSSLKMKCDQQSPIRLTFHDSSINDGCLRGNPLVLGSPTKQHFYFNDFRCDKMRLNPSCQSNSPQIQHHCCCSSKQLHPSRSSFDNSFMLTDASNRFVAPELLEETLLDRDHNEILAKLNFVVALVECITKLADHRGNTINLLTESSNKEVIDFASQ